MKKDFTYIAVVMDESGSMSICRDETIQGLNTFFEEQAKEKGECKVMLTKFSTIVNNPVFEDRDLREIRPLTRNDYCPGGLTALLDAVGSTIDKLGAKLARMKEEERPSQVIVLIQTDGEENVSREYTLQQVKQKVEHQQSKYNWTFVFLGQNIDAFASAAMIGIPKYATINYAKDSSVNAFHSVSEYVSSARVVGNVAAFTEDQRTVAMTKDAPVTLSVTNGGI